MQASISPSDARRPGVLGGSDIGDAVARRVLQKAIAASDGGGDARIEEIIYETVYHEESRLARAETDPRTDADRKFLALLRRQITHSSGEGRARLVESIVRRYTEQISGHFDAHVYQIATRVVPPTLSAVLRGFHRPEHPFRALFMDVDDRIVVDGETEALRVLSKIGTVVLAPTHVSNLDSVVLGSTIYRLGLPPFAYGAGLNLFTNSVMGFFMRNLGAYTVDRQKSDPLYRDTLKEYVTTLLAQGQHNLFFPGGTRSRSGAIETRLKLGLLGTAPVGFRRALETGSARARIFVVPCTLTYPLVLEASALVEDYLRAEGGAHYVDVRDESDRPRLWLDFLGGLLELDQRVYVTMGRALDVVGNPVDEAGASLDPAGHPIDPTDYFREEGELTADDARDAAYTQLLAGKLLSAYRRDNLVLPTAVSAFVVLALLHRQRPQPDLFRFLREIAPDASVDVALVLSELGTALRELRGLAMDESIRLHELLWRASPDEILSDALRTFGTYHTVPVLERRAARIAIGDVKLLFYYSNRLAGYGLLDRRELGDARETGGTE